MTVDDLSKMCSNPGRGDTAETCGTQTSPTSQGSGSYDKQGMTEPGYLGSVFDSTASQSSEQMVPTDLSIRGNNKPRRESLKASDCFPKRSLKNVIDNIVKKETLLSEIHYNKWPSHMSLPVMMPVLPPAVNTMPEQHTNLAKLLSNPLMPTEALVNTPSDTSPDRPRKHGASQLEEFPHKKFRPDISVPSEEAVCLKENDCSMSSFTKEGLYDPIKTEPISPKKDDSPGKQNRQNTEYGLLSADNASPIPNRASALRELLTSKRSSHQSCNEPVMHHYSEKLVIDEGVTPEFTDFDSDMSLASINEDDIQDKSRQMNTCQVCGQSFHYRSSFRRHMKVHQGIFSHVCAVCGRKFTRKEHFIRHKCSRKPNKASRGAHVESPVAAGIIPKVEFPPTQLPDQYHDELSCDSVHQELSATQMVTPQKVVHVYESRRKATVPRKVVMVEENDPDASFEEDPNEEYSMTECVTDKIRISESMECPSPAKAVCQANSPGQSERFPESPPKEQEMENCIKSEIKKCVIACQDSCGAANMDKLIARERASAKQHQAWASEVLDLSCPQVSSSCSPPQHADHPDAVTAPPQVNYNMALPTQQEFTIETGSYKVVTGAGGEMEEGTRNKFIKVVKQGNYLKLKEEAQIIGGQLCFVCPTCSKIFHRSSNFSRHMRIHRGVYSYVCPNCQRGFFRREHFQKHKCSRRGMSHTWDRKTKIDMVLAANESLLEGSDAEGGSERADSEESYTLSTERLENQ